MKRRDFLRCIGTVSAALAIPKQVRAIAQDSAFSRGWRAFEVTTRVEVLKPAGETRVWLPAALIRNTPFQRTLANRFDAGGGSATLVEHEADALGIITARFPSGVRPVLTLTSRVATRNYVVGLTAPGHAQSLSPEEREHFLRPTKLLPTDGIVRTTAEAITRGAKSDVQKARAIYEWVVENTFRNPVTRGCGTGDIRFMLETRDLGGKCADLNSLFVGLARATGLPARDVYGIRVAKSQLGYKSLGVSSENVTKAQHCRAEVYLGDFGWFPVDPADVRKVVLEEPPGNLPLDSEKVKSVHARLFGSWEMNWVAYNFAQDVILPESGAPSIPFLLYPQARTADGWIDSLDADSFRYEITSREVH